MSRVEALREALEWEQCASEELIKRRLQRAALLDLCDRIDTGISGEGKGEYGNLIDPADVRRILET